MSESKPVQYKLSKPGTTAKIEGRIGHKVISVEQGAPVSFDEKKDADAIRVLKENGVVFEAV